MGSLLALLSAVLFAIAALFVRRGMRGSTAIAATLISVLTNLVVLWALAAGTLLLVLGLALTIRPDDRTQTDRPCLGLDQLIPRMLCDQE